MTSRDQVTLISENGRIIDLKTESLSAGDQKYVRRIWYADNPITRISSVNSTILYPPFFFFNEIQAKLDQRFSRLIYPPWETLSNSSIKKFEAKVEAISPEGTPTLYLFDQAWRRLLTGTNKSSQLVGKIKAMRRDSKFKINLVLVDEPIYGNKLATTGGGFISDPQDVQKSLEQVDQFLERQDLGKNVTMVSTRKFKDRVQLLCPEWNLESREYRYMTEAAIVTVTTRSVPKLVEVQKTILAELTEEHGEFRPKENSFLGLSDDSLLKVEKTLQELISKK